MKDNGLGEIELDKALKKMTAKEVGVLAYKNSRDVSESLISHVNSCSEGQRKVFAVLKAVLVVVAILALERLGEILHIPYLSSIVKQVAIGG